ncbi:TRAP transporter small permease [Daeguia caeni]|uniref:TRAP transporter small permease protein n=1 Tax=Daeguia caeni TaxID=439612 RepID=A0ABV9H8C3_9HYPH
MAGSFPETGAASSAAQALGPVGWILSRLELFAGIVVFLMMILTGVDVFGRYFLGQSIRGSVELMQVMMAISIFAALPYLTYRGENIAVDLLPWIGRGYGWVHQIVIEIICAILILIMLPKLWSLAQRALQWDDRTDFLAIPTGYVQLFMTAMMALSALAALARAINIYLTRRSFKNGDNQ